MVFVLNQKVTNRESIKNEFKEGEGTEGKGVEGKGEAAIEHLQRWSSISLAKKGYFLGVKVVKSPVFWVFRGGELAFKKEYLVQNQKGKPVTKRASKTNNQSSKSRTPCPISL